MDEGLGLPARETARPVASRAVLEPEVIAAHQAAIDDGEPGYIDPFSRLYVLTEAYLRSRGRCCGSGCRHCPYRGAPDD